MSENAESVDIAETINYHVLISLSVADDNEDSNLTESDSKIVYPSYALNSKRLDSFVNWPVGLNQKPRDLADAGFFYLGTGDHVACFSCGIALNHWLPFDVPWNEHVKYMRSNCEYVRLMKDEEFIDNCKSLQDSSTLQQQQQESRTNSNDTEQENDVNKKILLDQQKNTCSVCVDNERLSTCGICMDNKRIIVFLPCNHLFSCTQCSLSVSLCPVCRKQINTRLKIYY